MSVCLDVPVGRPYTLAKGASVASFSAQDNTSLSRSSSMLLYVHRDRKDCERRGARDGHLDFHTTPEL